MPDTGAGAMTTANKTPAVAAAHSNLGAPSAGGLRDEFWQRARWAARVAWRGKHLVLACLALALIPTVLMLQQTPARYTAYANIMIEAPDVRDPLAERAFRPLLTDNVIQTEAALISSTLLARRVVDKLRLEEDPEFNPALRKPKPFDVFLASLNPLSWIPTSWRKENEGEAALSPTSQAAMAKARLVRAFQARLDVQAQRRTYIVTVTYTSESREKAALIANTVAETYVLDRLEAGFEDARRVAGWLGERLDSLRREVVAAESAVEEFRAQHGLRRKGDQKGSLTDQQLSELNSRLVLARSDLAQKQARLNQVRTLLLSRGSFEATSNVLESPLIQRLREQEATLLREMSDAQKVYGERHPRLVGLRAELGEIRGKIGSEVEKIAAALSNDLEIAVAGVRTMERELLNIRQQSDVAGEAEVRLRELERQAEANRNLYEAFLSRFKREAEQERMQRANARIVSPADPPMGKTYPRKAQTLTVVAAVALTVGLMLVFLLDRLDSAVRSGDEAEELTGLPVLGMIPLLRGGREKQVDELMRKPRSALADAVRSVRTSISSRGAEASRVIMVTSSAPKEGKTFVSLCLALMFSKSGERVLIIDADVHRPRLHSAIGVDGACGLAQVLNGEAGFDDAVRRGVIGEMDFLPAGRESNPGELIKAAEISAFLEQMKGRYDRVVVDTAPVLAVADTRVIAPLVGCVVYLVRWNATPRDAVRNGLKLLRSVGCAPFGIVLSQVDQRKHSRYGYGDYGQYYGRYHEYYAE